MSSYWLLREAVSHIKPLSDEYLLYPSSVTDSQPDVESDCEDRMNSQSLLMEPSLMPSPPDTTSSRSANSSSSSFLNFNEFYDDVHFPNVEPEELR